MAKTYRHFKKGTLYEVVCFAKHCETEEELVVYRSVEANQYWVRPKEMFFGTVQKDGKEVKRFEEVPETTNSLPRC